MDWISYSDGTVFIRPMGIWLAMGLKVQLPLSLTGMTRIHTGGDSKTRIFLFKKFMARRQATSPFASSLWSRGTRRRVRQ